jgi:hypothetical protein
VTLSHVYSVKVRFSGRKMIMDEDGPDIGASQLFPTMHGEMIPEAYTEGNDSTSTISETGFAKLRKNGFLRRCWDIITWTPPRCRWDPKKPPKFSMTLNLLFAFVSNPSYILKANKMISACILYLLSKTALLCKQRCGKPCINFPISFYLRRFYL